MFALRNVPYSHRVKEAKETREAEKAKEAIKVKPAIWVWAFIFLMCFILNPIAKASVFSERHSEGWHWYETFSWFRNHSVQSGPRSQKKTEDEPQQKLAQTP